MNRPIRIVLVVLLLALVGCSDDEPEATGPCGALGGLGPRDAPLVAAGHGDDRAEKGPAPIRLIVFTKTADFRHDTIPVAIERIRDLEPDSIEVTVTEDAAELVAALDDHDLVAFVNTTGDVLDDAQQETFRAWLEGGGAFVGVHAATDTEHDWDWYGQMIGARFTQHPPFLQTVDVIREDPNDPSVAHLTDRFSYTEEWYDFDRNPRDTSNVLLSIDEETAVYEDGAPVEEFTTGEDHPVAWSRQQGDGRVWYTALGHDAATWDDPDFLDHLREGITWAAEPGRWHVETITDEVEAPVALDVADSHLVLWAQRDGDINVWDPATGRIRSAGTIDTRMVGDGGLMGLRLAPDAAETGELFVYATLPGEGAVGANALQRLVLDVDCRFDPAEAETILEVPNEFAGHQGGDIAFEDDETILLTTGDDTTPTGLYAAIGGPDLPETADARRTSAEPSDLRGKVLRVSRDGSIPDGNMFPPDGGEGRPEVYLMGFRNPFRMGLDPDGRLFVGDLGPDAFEDAPEGPVGLDELNFADGPADFGWPLCIGDRRPYADLDPETGEPGEAFDCSDTVPPVLSYSYSSFDERALGNGHRESQIGTLILGRSLMVAGWYDPPTSAPAAAPMADRLLLHEFARNLLLTASIGDDGSVGDMRTVAPWVDFHTPVDVEVGPDGSIYVLEFGKWNETSSGEPALVRLAWSATGERPDLPEVELEERTDGPGEETALQIFDRNCSSCHGASGVGNIGPALIGIEERLTLAERIEVITDGRDAMPAWGDRLDPEDIRAVAEYLEQLDAD